MAAPSAVLSHISSKTQSGPGGNKIQIQIKSYNNMSSEPSGLLTWWDPVAKLGRSRETSGSSRACSGSAVLPALARNTNKGESASSPGALLFLWCPSVPILAVKDFPRGNLQNKPLNSVVNKHHHVHSQREKHHNLTFKAFSY